MEVQVLAPTIQRYKGENYYICGKYYQRAGVRLHVTVWEDVNGTVPHGFCVHHKDFDRANNSIENLYLIRRDEHTSLHQKGHGRKLSPHALSEAAKWHGSEEGRRWHNDHYAKFGHTMHVKKEHICEVCSKTFISDSRKNIRFCSNNCKSQARRLSGVDNIERNCVVCGASFVVNRYVAKRTCTRKCASVLSRSKKI
jgi:predicted nucleic acid-binding Zn ribbon protein